MSREIRRVPPDWVHPNWQAGEIHYGEERKLQRYKPLYDQSYEEAAEEWIEGFMAWQAGEHPEYSDGYKYYWEYDSTPNETYYRTRRWTPEEATAYQIYETVSEGTPISPVFETLADMRDWLIKQGHSEASADGFIGSGWVPSFVVFNPPGGPVEMASGIDIAGLLARKQPPTEATK